MCSCRSCAHGAEPRWFPSCCHQLTLKSTCPAHPDSTTHMCLQLPPCPTIHTGSRTRTRRHCCAHTTAVHSLLIFPPGCHVCAQAKPFIAKLKPIARSPAALGELLKRAQKVRRGCSVCYGMGCTYHMEMCQLCLEEGKEGSRVRGMCIAFASTPQLLGFSPPCLSVQRDQAPTRHVEHAWMIV